MSFKSIFIAVVLGTALIVAAVIFNAGRPEHETEQPKAEFVRATGKCATCHRRETAAIVHQFEGSRHAKKGRQLPGLPSGVGRAGIQSAQRIYHRQTSDCKEL